MVGWKWFGRKLFGGGFWGVHLVHLVESCGGFRLFLAESQALGSYGATLTVAACA